MKCASGVRVIGRFVPHTIRDSVRENQDVVCTLHRGLTRGLLDRLAPTATLERFVPHDPDRAGCEIDIGGLASAAS
jgi:hypothetical protein